MVVQVNGRPRKSHIMVLPELSKDETEARAKADPRTIEFIAGKKIVKVVVIPATSWSTLWCRDRNKSI